MGRILSCDIKYGFSFQCATWIWWSDFWHISAKSSENVTQQPTRRNTNNIAFQENSNFPQMIIISAPFAFNSPDLRVSGSSLAGRSKWPCCSTAARSTTLGTKSRIRGSRPAWRPEACGRRERFFGRISGLPAAAGVDFTKRFRP
jgi:hypothetical protein